MKKKTKIILIAIIAIAILWFAKGTITGNATANSNDNIKIPLSEISEQAKWYDYNSKGTQISFFAIKAADGIIKKGIIWTAG